MIAGRTSPNSRQTCRHRRIAERARRCHRARRVTGEFVRTTRNALQSASGRRACRRKVRCRCDRCGDTIRRPEGRLLTRVAAHRLASKARSALAALACARSTIAARLAAPCFRRYSILRLCGARPPRPGAGRRRHLPRPDAAGRHRDGNGPVARGREAARSRRVEASPVDSATRHYLAEVLWHRGATDAALVQMEAAVRLDETDPSLDRALRRNVARHRGRRQSPRTGRRRDPPQPETRLRLGTPRPSLLADEPDRPRAGRPAAGAAIRPGQQRRADGRRRDLSPARPARPLPHHAAPLARHVSARPRHRSSPIGWKG